MEIISLRPTASSLYSPWDGDSDPRRPCWTFALRFLRAFPLFFGLPIYGLFSAVYFGYVVTGHYVLSMRGFCGTQYRRYDASLVFLVLQRSTMSDGFLCWSLWRSVNCQVSCVHLPVWLKSQEFPETESPAGFAAVEASARFLGPAHQGFSGFCCLSGVRDQHKGRRPKNPSSNSQRPLLWSSHPQGLLRGLFSQVSPRLPPAVSPQRQTLRRACLRAVPRLPRSPGIAF